MKIKAIITLSLCGDVLCSNYKKVCTNGYCEICDNYIAEDDHIIGCICRNEKEKTIYMEKEVKEIEIDRTDGIKVTIDKKTYYNDIEQSDIKELSIEGKEIIKDYELVKEILE